MYAYAAIQVERPNVLTLPASAVATRGNVNEGYQDFCFLLENGKVRRTFIEVGSRGDETRAGLEEAGSRGLAGFRRRR